MKCYKCKSKLIRGEKECSKCGTTLKEIIESRSLSFEQIGHYMISLCETLEKLHSHNPPLIHRDIFFAVDEAVQLLDQLTVADKRGLVFIKALPAFTLRKLTE